jgi:hypothetical protein
MKRKDPRRKGEDDVDREDKGLKRKGKTTQREEVEEVPEGKGEMINRREEKGVLTRK